MGVQWLFVAGFGLLRLGILEGSCMKGGEAGWGAKIRELTWPVGADFKKYYEV